METGYPSVPAAMDCSSGNTFRLASYSDEQVMPTVAVRRRRGGKPAVAHANG